jgi:hypothetical protein
MTEFQNYRPDGPWSELIDLVAIIERAPDYWRQVTVRPWEEIAARLHRLANRFELMHSQQERDLARLFRALADIAVDDPDGDDGEEVPTKAAAVEDTPLSGD